MRKERAIYGDDDQAKVLSLFDQEEEIQRLVDISNRQIMKERFKSIKKKKVISDTTKNATKPIKAIDDVREGKPDKKKKEKKEKVKKTEKKLNPKGVKKVIVIFLLLITVLIVVNFRKEIVDIAKNGVSSVTSIFSSIFNKEKETESVISINEDAGTDKDGNVKGYMTDAETKDYTLENILDIANTSNTILQNYYRTLVEIAGESKTSDVADKIKESSSMIATDKASLETYADKFAKYEGGSLYYNSLKYRFDHLSNFLARLEYIDQEKIYNYINLAISEENDLIEDGKSELKNFLDANSIPYTDEGDKIVYKFN